MISTEGLTAVHGQATPPAQRAIDMAAQQRRSTFLVLPAQATLSGGQPSRTGGHPETPIPRCR